MQRGHLNRQRIASAAIALLDETGLDGLSMRKLGASLGVEAMSLYNHVRNKADLLDTIHAHLLESMGEELAKSPPTQGWEKAAAGLARAFLRLLKAHPNAIPLFASRSAIAPGSLALVDDSIGLLLGAGFTPVESMHAFQTLFALTIGHAVFHYGPRSADSFAKAEDYARHQHLAGLAHPELRPPDDEFEFGLEAVLAGLRQRLDLRARS